MVELASPKNTDSQNDHVDPNSSLFYQRNSYQDSNIQIPTDLQYVSLIKKSVSDNNQIKFHSQAAQAAKRQSVLGSALEKIGQELNLSLESDKLKTKIIAQILANKVQPGPGKNSSNDVLTPENLKRFELS
mmetsp:Transcript_43341/g.41746  ORF Transcript_43341/g.41746 Transcript_43341/m.41746 type:complete len:131 (+) Transcript_43341:247-639(+)